MLNKLFSKRNTPILQIGRESKELPAAVEKAITEVRMPGDVASNEAEVEIKNIGSVPEYKAILTAPGTTCLYPLPSHLEYQIMALEVGPSRAALLYAAADHITEIKECLAEVNNTLVAKGYFVDPVYLSCTSTVIKESLANYKRQSGNSKSVAGQSVLKKLWESWIEIAYREGASDLHILFMGNTASIKIRVDGSLESLPDSNNGVYTATMVHSAISWAYQELTVGRSNNTSMYDENQDVNAMFKPITVDNKQIGARFQSLKGAYGPKVTCRLISDIPSMTFQVQGFEESHIALFNEVARRSTGLIISAGVTNSGKSTFLRTYIESHPDNGSAAFTVVEDAVETKIKGTHQYPFQRPSSDQAASKKMYDDLIAGLLRSDPDGVVMGEVRDAPSANAVETLIKTGCFAICTLHANFISGIIPRLTDKGIGIDISVLTQEKLLSLLLYQSLVPKVCEKCGIHGDDDNQFSNIYNVANSDLAGEAVRYYENEVKETLGLLHSRFDLPASRFRFKRRGGCKHCKGRGTKGITAVAEALIPDANWLELISKNSFSDANKYYRNYSDGKFDTPDMHGKTVFEHALYKAQLGIVDPRICLTFDSFKTFDVRSNSKVLEFGKFKKTQKRTR